MRLLFVAMALCESGIRFACYNVLGDAMKKVEKPNDLIWYKSERFLSKEGLRIAKKYIDIHAGEKTIWGVRILNVIAHHFVGPDGRYVKISFKGQSVWLKL